MRSSLRCTLFQMKALHARAAVAASFGAQQQPRRKRGRRTPSEAEESFSDDESEASASWSVADSTAPSSAPPSLPPTDDEDSDM